ncbi:hypothetical protein DU500_14295 [Haloplanus rubicundus]|uniref:Uncharacterized protein n=1 Tax=Haloplanus rubicundus TaxID=1547898 RepID=A0A345E5M9_9EURY|nr:hypothetical protein DU500_14295 [Haloplanus rubicundus]AXG10916.1 hypothetical protein DU484_14265 [Haloplanus rubicundus]
MAALSTVIIPARPSVTLLTRGVVARCMNLPSTTTPDGLFEYLMALILLAAVLGYAVLYFGG